MRRVGSPDFVIVQAGQPAKRPKSLALWYTFRMSKRLEEVVADVRELPAEEQDRVAEAVLTFLSELQDDTWQAA